MLQHLLAERFAMTIHQETKARAGLALVDNCSLLSGQARGSLPVGLSLPNNISATPWPSVPGSQAATSASA